MPTASHSEQVEAGDLRRPGRVRRRARDDRAATRRFEDLDVDSLDLVELAQIVEDEFGVELDGDDVKDVKTVGDVDRPGGGAAPA